jgi:multisubunit Na+/H+ antiporter MnhC subunit
VFLFDCFAIVIFAQSIVRAAVHPPPRAHFFFNDFKQPARYLPQTRVITAIVFSLLFTMALCIAALCPRQSLDRAAHAQSVESATICKQPSVLFKCVIALFLMGRA